MSPVLENFSRKFLIGIALLCFVSALYVRFSSPDLYHTEVHIFNFHIQQWLFSHFLIQVGFIFLGIQILMISRHKFPGWLIIIFSIITIMNMVESCLQLSRH